jgi:two-component system, cell cycle response regulator
VAALSVEVGAALGLQGQELADLRVAAQLHDLGKIALPDGLLAKPGPLDEDEIRVVRTHPVVGAELLTAWGLPRLARFVREHHERVDGLGYPAGLTADEISLEARIIHAADAFASMTAERPYGPALSAEAALAEIRRLRGAEFDAEVAAALETRISDTPTPIPARP